MRHVCAIDDLSNEEILSILRDAADVATDLRGRGDLFSGKLLASLFFEPSTRTRLSFEAAMFRGGGQLIHHESAHSTSLAGKGESLQDSIQVISSYVDAVVMRHPLEGAARVAADISKVPVINAGDGSHEHPTQTLCDLYVLWREYGTLEGLNVLFRGDLRYGRTVHSLVVALARFGATLLVSPSDGLGLPEYVDEVLQEQYGARAVQGKDGSGALPDDFPFPIRAVYCKPGEWKGDQAISAVYATRIQKERFPSSGAATAAERKTPPIEDGTMRDKRLRNAIVMHPLPRVDEISREFDSDPRSKYFDQAAAGVPVRMALLRWLFDRVDEKDATAAKSYRSGPGECTCRNLRCISRGERVAPVFMVIPRPPFRLQCRYCDAVFVPLVGNRTTKSVSTGANVVEPDEDLVFFDSEEQARASGYQIR